MSARTGFKTTAFIGLFFISVYLVLATRILPVPDHLAMTLAFLIGPAAIAGVLSIWRTMRDEPRMTAAHTETLLAGSVFLVIAFALFNLMLVVQQTIHAYYQELLATADSDTARSSLRLIFRMVNPVQLGVDISFDVFYCLGIILVSVAMFRSRLYGRALAIYGIVTAAALLAFNLWTFPKPPASSGLIDLGPATALWWIALIVQMLRAARVPPMVRPEPALP